MLIASSSYRVKGKEIWDFDNLLLNTGWLPYMVLLNTSSTSKLAYLCYLKKTVCLLTIFYIPMISVKGLWSESLDGTLKKLLCLEPWVS